MIEPVCYVCLLSATVWWQLCICSAFHLFVTGQQNLMPASRFPALRRPQQLHNVALALNTMQKAGLNVQVSLDLVGININEVIWRYEDLSLMLQTLTAAPKCQRMGYWCSKQAASQLFLQLFS